MSKNDEKKCYKFIETVSIGGTIYEKGSCIKLLKTELADYQDWIAPCTGPIQAVDSGECKTC